MQMTSFARGGISANLTFSLAERAVELEKWRPNIPQFRIFVHFPKLLYIKCLILNPLCCSELYKPIIIIVHITFLQFKPDKRANFNNKGK